MNRVTFCALLAASLRLSLWGQPAFEAASIKPSLPGNAQQRAGMVVRGGCTGGPGTRDPGQFTCREVSLLALVSIAYDCKIYQVAGPAWLDNDKFDLFAKLPAGTTRQQVPAMLQGLLAERFKLTFHRGKQDIPGYELVVAKNGSKLHQSGDSPPPAAVAPAAATGGGSDSRKQSAAGEDGFPMRPATRVPTLSVANGRARRQVTWESMETFAAFLSQQVQRPVADATGLQGRYDITLIWALAGPSAAVAASAVDESGPTLAEAVQGQLGLRLKPAIVPVDMLIVDQAGKAPVEN